MELVSPALAMLVELLIASDLPLVSPARIVEDRLVVTDRVDGIFDDKEPGVALASGLETMVLRTRSEVSCPEAAVVVFRGT